MQRRAIVSLSFVQLPYKVLCEYGVLTTCGFFLWPSLLLCCCCCAVAAVLLLLCCCCCAVAAMLLLLCCCCCDWCVCVCVCVCVCACRVVKLNSRVNIQVRVIPRINNLPRACNST